jgi:hypothetical protein
MAESQTLGEHHSCLVCRRVHHVHVTYNSQGSLLACVPTRSGVRVLPVPDQPVIVCVEHTGLEVAAALAALYAEADAHAHVHDDDEGE